MLVEEVEKWSAARRASAGLAGLIQASATTQMAAYRLTYPSNIMLTEYWMDKPLDNAFDLDPQLQNQFTNVNSLKLSMICSFVIVLITFIVFYNYFFSYFIGYGL